MRNRVLGQQSSQLITPAPPYQGSNATQYTTTLVFIYLIDLFAFQSRSNDIYPLPTNIQIWSTCRKDLISGKSTPVGSIFRYDGEQAFLFCVPTDKFISCVCMWGILYRIRLMCKFNTNIVSSKIWYHSHLEIIQRYRKRHTQDKMTLQIVAIVLLSIVTIVDWQNIDGLSDTSILKTTVSTTNDIGDSWKTRWKWWEIVSPYKWWPRSNC